MDYGAAASELSLKPEEPWILEDPQPRWMSPVATSGSRLVSWATSSVDRYSADTAVLLPKAELLPSPVFFTGLFRPASWISDMGLLIAMHRHACVCNSHPQQKL